MCAAPLDTHHVRGHYTVVGEIPRDALNKIGVLRNRDDAEGRNELVELLCKYAIREDESFTRLERDTQPSVRCLRNLGWIKSNQGRQQEAVVYFKGAVTGFGNEKPDLRYDVLYKLATSLETLANENVINTIEAIDFYAQAIQIRLVTERQFARTVRPESIVERLQVLLRNLPKDPPPNQRQRFVQLAINAGESLLVAERYQMAQQLFELCLRLPDDGPERFRILMNLFKCHKNLDAPFVGLSYLDTILIENGRTDEERQKAAQSAISILRDMELAKTNPYEVVTKQSIRTLTSVLVKLAPFSFQTMTIGNLPPKIPRRFCEQVCDELYKLPNKTLGDFKACFQQLLWIANTHPDMNMIRYVEFLCDQIPANSFHIIQEAFLSFARIQFVIPIHTPYPKLLPKAAPRSDVRFSSYEIARLFARVGALYEQQHDDINELHCLRIAILAGWSDEGLQRNADDIPRWWKRFVECYNGIEAPNEEAQTICAAFNQSLRSRGVLG